MSLTKRRNIWSAFVVVKAGLLASVCMESHFFHLQLRLLGGTLWLNGDPADDALGGDHSLRHLRPLRFRTESEALRAIDAAGVGHWSSFPHEGIRATLSRSQLRAIGFRGNF